MNPKEEGSDSSPERDDGNVWAEQLKVFESGHRNLQIDRWSSQKKEKKNTKQDDAVFHVLTFSLPMLPVNGREKKFKKNKKGV